MNAHIYSLLKILLLLAVLVGSLTLALPVIFLAMYLCFLKDCFVLGCGVYVEWKKYIGPKE